MNVKAICIKVVRYYCFLLFVFGNQVIVAQDDVTPIAPPMFIQKLDRGENLKFVCYGTSLTASGEWVNQVDRFFYHSYPGQVTVVNSGQGGQHSDWGLRHFKSRVLDVKPDVLFLEFAVNDAVERFHIPEERSRRNIETMISMVRASNPEVEIVLQVTNPVIDRPHGHPGHRPNLEQLFVMVRDISKERSTLLIDHEQNWKDILVEDPSLFKRYISDGLHPNALGCASVVTPKILYQLGCISIEAYQDPEQLQAIIGSGESNTYYTGSLVVGGARCRGIGVLSAVPVELKGKVCYIAPRGKGGSPGSSYTIELEKDYTVYISVHERGVPSVGEWEKTDMTIEWEVNGSVYQDRLYRKFVKAGALVIPSHDGQDSKNGLYGVPHLCVIVD